jgi:hypothetical protein
LEYFPVTTKKRLTSLRNGDTNISPLAVVAKSPEEFFQILSCLVNLATAAD